MPKGDAEERAKIKALGTELYQGMDVSALTGMNAAATMASAGIQGMMQNAAALEAKLVTELEKEALKSQIQALRYKAQACYVEGTRQITKQVTKIADPRNTFRMSRGGSDMFSQQAPQPAAKKSGTGVGVKVAAAALAGLAAF